MSARPRTPRCGANGGGRSGSTGAAPSAALWPRLGLLALSVLLAALVAAPVAAQVAPSPAQAKAYTGALAAAQRGDAAELRQLAAAGPAARVALEAQDPQGRRPLHVATFARHRDALTALLDAGVDTAALENDRYDAVTIAAVANDEDSLRLLLARGASAGLVTSRYDGTALIAAAHLGHAGVVRQLIAAGAPLDHVNNLHWTALIEAVVLGHGGPSHQAVVRALLRAGASTSLTDRQGRTPLQLAQERGHAEMVAMLKGQAGR